jgi:hypothetical protein
MFNILELQATKESMGYQRDELVSNALNLSSQLRERKHVS